MKSLSLLNKLDEKFYNVQNSGVLAEYNYLYFLMLFLPLYLSKTLNIHNPIFPPSVI